MATDETGRIEAFSDAVFAIAITLLVLDLKVPRGLEGGRALGTALAAMWPAYPCQAIGEGYRALNHRAVNRVTGVFFAVFF